MGLKEECLCTLTVNYITEPEFVCPEEANDVIYKAKLFQAPDANTADLISDLENWVQNGPGEILVQNIRLYIDPSCGVRLTSSCRSQTQIPTSSVFVTAEGDRSGDDGSVSANDIVVPVVVAIAIAAVLVIVVIVVALHIFTRIRHKKQDTYDIAR